METRKTLSSLLKPNSIELNRFIGSSSSDMEHIRTQSNLIEPNRTFDLPNFWEVRYDCVRLPNLIEHNRVIGFDWLRVRSIIRTFGLVRLVRSGFDY